MFGPFKSRAQREREAVRDVVIEGILKSEAAARSEIHLLESAVEATVRPQALIRLVKVLVACGRTEKEVAVWQARAESLKAKGDVGRIMGMSFVLELIMAFNLAAFIGPKASLGFGLFAGAAAGFGWVALSLGVTYLFER